MINKKFAKFVCKTYLKFRKTFSSKFLYKTFAEKYESKQLWPTVREYNIRRFSDYINSYEYVSDPLNGAVDFSHPEDEPDYFFADLSKGRDCDNWSRIWLCYLKYHEQDWVEITEVVVFNTSTFKNCFATSHFITIAKNKKNNRYYCFNYDYSGKQYVNFEDAVYEVCDKSSTYTKDNLVWIKY